VPFPLPPDVLRHVGRGKREGGPASRAPSSSERSAVELRGDQNAVAVNDDRAARDLGLVGDHRLELLVANQLATTFVDSVLCSGVSKRLSELKTPFSASIR